MSNRHAATTVAMIFALLTASPSTGTTRVVPHTLQSLAGVWVGAQYQGALEFLRLELDSRGTGSLTIQYLPGQPAVAYQVLGTSLNQYSVNFRLSPVDTDAEPIYLHGNAAGSPLELQIGGTELEWHRSVRLEPYVDLIARIDAVNQRAAELATQQP